MRLFEAAGGGTPLLLLLVSLVSFGTCRVMAQKSYIVHMDTSYMPKHMATHDQWYRSVVKSAKLVGTQATYDEKQLNGAFLYTYHRVISGFSAVLGENELEAVKNVPGFLSAYMDRAVSKVTTHTTDFLGMSLGSGLWPASDYGKDVIIGVIDTGVWPESASFRDDGMAEIPQRWKGKCEGGEGFGATLCNRKLIGVSYFNKGAKAALDPNTTISIPNSGRDTEGHGTHTSSTAAGNYVEEASFFGYAAGAARGVAPRARLAIYKVLWDVSTASDVLAGIEQAVADGVDVISISLAPPYNVSLYEDPIAIGSFGAMAKGILVSTPGGNSGPKGRGSLENGIPWALTSAAGSIDRWFAGTVSLASGEEITGWTTYPLAKPISGQLPLVYNKTMSHCNSTHLFSNLNASSIVVCESENFHSLWKQSGFLSYSKFVKAAIFISDNPDLHEFVDFPYPGIVISREQSYGIIKYCRSSNGVRRPHASIQLNQKTLLGTKGNPVVASYSSRGPAPSCPLVLKPDLMAPGTLVLAAWPPAIRPTYILRPNNVTVPLQSSHGFNIDYGTSMSCAHSSGIAALLKGAHPEWSPAAIRSAMITTANPKDNTDTPIKDPTDSRGIASPLSMGAGQVDPNRALDPGLVYDATPQDYVDLLCSMHFYSTQIQTITTSSKYNCSTRSSDLNYPSFILLYHQYHNQNVTRTFYRTVTYVGDGPETYTLDASQLPQSFHTTFNPVKLSFKKKYDKENYTFTLTYKGSQTGEVDFGSFTFVGDNGKHSVRSPVVVAPMINTW
ncbi:unnamed protein product [Cuscuta epithymum]|uniref:Uncharacterized protein n=1 Tax=Cuscuta epithymum TaxID=186058 RepID=A0AAV0F9B3_9ASTE|nr:unnamed protein product [Cuscuta epithymum]